MMRRALALAYCATLFSNALDGIERGDWLAWTAWPCACWAKGLTAVEWVYLKMPVMEVSEAAPAT